MKLYKIIIILVVFFKTETLLSENNLFSVNNIQLEKKDNSTILKYSVEAQIGGKLAQLGSRLIDSTSKKLAGKFFNLW